ncbi:uncharacterized protein H6S33_003237 [Morchella sextelata]|uniref:uncharacterized protein n=1 Tax=Morchella sextelata TaxID=1174677 RepID=UPI001D05AEA9|nr:uncharacterized protein H6S33_003237 [Morchella sextelata]KAH0607249.1 hypothetical protein H6S33_003237 [Morchella sextelata]
MARKNTAKENSDDGACCEELSTLTDHFIKPYRSMNGSYLLPLLYLGDTFINLCMPNTIGGVWGTELHSCRIRRFKA